MIGKITGTVLLVIGVFGCIVLLTYGGPVLPHIIGPTILGVIGAFVLFFKRKPV